MDTLMVGQNSIIWSSEKPTSTAGKFYAFFKSASNLRVSYGNIDASVMWRDWEGVNSFSICWKYIFSWQCWCSWKINDKWLKYRVAFSKVHPVLTPNLLGEAEETT